MDWTRKGLLTALGQFILQKILRCVLLAAFIIFGRSVMGEIDDYPTISAGAETETISRYLWRGLAYSDGTVQQSHLRISSFNFTVSVWLYLRPHVAYYSILSESYQAVIDNLEHWGPGIAFGSEF